ncbi:magnesium-translocating P-type ATPase [Lactobacillus rodentium]|uniref:Magnesium-transporting ATPase, P-type 1 n=1 Tax=Lactobacillus rodentium TaxID=947835 RepID=A0A2Z6TUM3_9LACO|nr:magnesium-translocating P-type ATPase [Lactobacillus rodentium]MCR1895106.1 magnesium-translocating P-type ATPase [Lactobacillus rodentium]GBG05429.1 magnesium-translocating P-type ATPase [Lactobacillus rodentium]
MLKITNPSKKMMSNIKLVRQIAQEDKFATLQRLHTSINGLYSADARQRLEKFGPNEVAKKPTNTRIQFLIQSFLTPFTIVLLILATISFFSEYLFVPASQKDLSTTIIMLIMVLISGVTGYIQNIKTNNAVEDLLNIVSVTTNIRRNGENIELPTKDVVIGDIINLSAGDMVPADMRLLKTKDLFCSASSLNGESEPTEKIANARPKSDELKNYLDYPNIAYEGTTIVSGSGIGVVFATGEKTVFGKIAQNISKNKIKETSFDLGIRDISKMLLIMTAIIAPTVFIIDWLTKGNWLDALLFGIATAVGLTPEMLPVIVTSNLVTGSVEMSKQGTIVRTMSSIQNFGSADILCTDKTGTLTQNKVMLERHYDLDLQEQPDILKYAYLNAYFQTGMKNLIDRSIINAANNELDVNDINHDYSKVDEIPFDFKRRRVSVVVANAENEHVLVTKGAAEEMLACSTKIEVNNKVEPLTDERRTKIMSEINHMSADGMRIILLGYKRDPAAVGAFSPEDENNLILTGFLAFLDPPKESAKETIQTLNKDGINVKILTGDTAIVTRKIAVDVGINADVVYSGKDFVDKSEAEKQAMVEECNIFVKLSPQDKADIIDLLKKNDHTVAYMGDGINDASAMKAADVSVSVDTAVDIAKKSADIILLEKDLAILEKGVTIGRRVFGNTMKYIEITLSSNFGNILSILLASIFLPFLPMSPMQLLILELIYSLSCLSIPFDTMNEHYLQVPRKWSTKKLPKFMLYFGPVSSIFDVITFGLLFFWICPQIVGNSWFTATSSQRALFITIFAAGWFVESLWTQEILIQVLRDPRIPFIQQHSSPAVAWATLGAGVIGTLLPFITPIAKIMKFGPLPLYYLGLVVILLILYIALTTIVKYWYLKKEKFLI